MKKLRVVQIGTEHDHAGEAMMTLKRLPDLFELVGFCMPEEDTTCVFEKNRERYEGVPKLSLEEVFADRTLDAAVIETSDYLLTRYAKKALDAGLHVEMDKPGGMDQAEFEEMVDTAGRRGLALQLGYMYRFNPAILELYDRVARGELGEILYINAEMNCWHRAPKRQWLADYPGGMMYFLGCHLVDVIYRLQGEPLEVLPLHASSDGDGVRSYDVSFIALRYPHGTSFARTTAVERGGANRRQIVVVGTKGTFEIRPTEYPIPEEERPADDPCADLRTDYRVCTDTKWHAKGEWTSTVPYNRYMAMFRSFAAIARGEKKNPYTAEYEKNLHRIVLKAAGGYIDR